MSLSLKLLVPLNLLIVAVWTAHVVASRSALEDAMLTVERDAMFQLATSLQLRLEEALAEDRGVEPLAADVARIVARWPGLDIMILDRDLRVRVASDPGRVGGPWHEPGIEAIVAGAAETAVNLGRHHHDGRRAVDVSLGVAGPDGGVRHVVHVAKWLDGLRAATRLQRSHDLASAVLELASVAVAVNLLTLFLVLRPLQRIRREIASSGWLDEHFRHVEGGDEIRQLGQVVTALLDQVRRCTDRLEASLGERETVLELVSADRDELAHRYERVTGALEDAEARLVRAERIAAVAQLSGALAHELRNPLHIIRATAETMAGRSPGLADLSHDIMDEVDRINRLITELLDYSRPSDLQLERIELRELLKAVRERMCRGMCSRDPSSCLLCRVAVDVGASAVVGDRMLLEQAILNLMANAREASPEDAEIELRATPDGSDEVVVSVADRGPGVATRDRPRLFEPFFTRKAGGTGLGLPAVQKIADLHGGAVALEPRPGGGTVASLRLPVRQPEDGS